MLEGMKLKMKVKEDVKEKIIDCIYEDYKKAIKTRANYNPDKIDPTGEIIWVIENAVAITIKSLKEDDFKWKRKKK